MPCWLALSALAPTAGVLPVSFGEMDPSTLFDLGPWRTREHSADVERWLGEAALTHHDHHHHHDPNCHDKRSRAFYLRRAEPIPARSLAVFLELLTASLGENLLRMKGIINLADDPDHLLVVHAVQHLFHEPLQLDGWPSEDRDTRVVFILRGVEESSVAKLLDALTRLPDPTEVLLALAASA